MRATILFLCLTLILASCTNKKETSFLLSHTNKGLNFDNYLAVVWKDTLKENIVSLDSTIELQIIGLTGFNIVNGKAFVGTSMSVKDSIGVVLFQNDDIFIEYDTIGFDPEMVKDWVGIYLETSHPMKKGSIYTWSIRIWDKKSDADIMAEALLKMK